MKITLPLPPNRGNARWHWRTEKRKKTEYWQRCDMRRLAGNIPPPPDSPPETVKVRATLFVHSRMDRLDNMYSRLKWTWDWLVAHGYMAGDRGDQADWSEPPGQVIDRRNQRVEIELA